jgi:hypothetical protein
MTVGAEPWDTEWGGGPAELRMFGARRSRDAGGRSPTSWRGGLACARAWGRGRVPHVVTPPRLPT